MKTPLRLTLVAAVLLAGACATVPTGPSFMALPGSGRSFDQFRLDDAECRQFASAQVGGATASEAATDSGVRSAVVGTAVGAAAGAAIDGSRGAGAGAGAGLLIGALAGSSAAHASAHGLQQRYDIGYKQCMYAKGHKIPVYGRYMSSREPGATTPPPPRTAPPPPRPYY